MTKLLTPAEPPTPTRLKRTALLVAGGAIALTLVIAALTLVRSRPPASRGPAVPEPAPQQPSGPGFMAQPPRTIDERALQELLARPPALSDASFEDEPFPDPAAGDLTLDGTLPAPPPPDPRGQALLRALLAPIQPAGAASRDAQPSREDPLAGSASPLPDSEVLRGLLALPAAIRPPAPAATTPPTALTGSGTGQSAPLAPAIERPSSPFRLQAGTVLPAILLTAVHSDLPGAVVAQLARDVYDSTHQTHLLLPRGARLVGRYENQIALGQDRLLVAWDRLLLPDGTSFSLPGLPATAPSGEAGLPGAVDNHYARVFGNAVLLSLVSAGVQLSQPQQGASLGQAPSTGQVAAGALGQELGAVALEVVRRNLAIRPTIRLRAGLELNVLLAADLVLPGPYASRS